ncbi:hypothetical protein P3T18_003674 [Paraburkholderia sp. GAS199]|uniref:hypothetical protein n=1 Tax=Paraburkholderia sp. GAS199 TaxID=3035126 RepID=UPI003D19E298
MDRRMFITGGVCLPAIVAEAANLWPFRAMSEPHTLAVVDITLTRGAAFADHLARANQPVMASGDDIGTLWYTTLAPRLARTPCSLLGLTRASDYFVLRHLAVRAGLIECRHERHGGNNSAHCSTHYGAQHSKPAAESAFLLSPRLAR